MYTCSMCVHTLLYMWFTTTCTYTCPRVYMYTYICMCIYIYIYVCIHANYMYKCTYIVYIRMWLTTTRSKYRYSFQFTKPRHRMHSCPNLIPGPITTPSETETWTPVCVCMCARQQLLTSYVYACHTYVCHTHCIYNRLFMQLRNLCILAQKRQFQMYVDFIYAWLYMGCGYPTVDINYANYICAISVLLA